MIDKHIYIDRDVKERERERDHHISWETCEKFKVMQN
jgi:hypothetical protein